ncbi:type IV conjugative transfer system protein TraL [Vibrio sp. 10N.239.312.D08]|uniref:type IV conjugative transfer system protein TraL n=1 Tax=Vibrio sp. 10N.239.312.D08 TaxID=3229978 RepID=UPI00354C78A3
MLAPNQDEIPYRVNEPKMVGPFSVTEVAPIAVMGMIGIVMNATNYGLMAGGALTLIQIKLGKNFPPGYVKHYLWFQGVFPTMVTKYLPDPIQRRFYQ